MPEENKIKKEYPKVELDTSGPEVDVSLPEEKKEEVVENKEQEAEIKEVETKVNFVFPKKEKYIGSHIKSKLGDEYASNESYEAYYKDLI